MEIYCYGVYLVFDMFSNRTKTVPQNGDKAKTRRASNNSLGPCSTYSGSSLGIVALGLFAACLLYGDGMITPAISVMSAVEGIGIVTPMSSLSQSPFCVACF